jgi:hypothetical protein
MQVTPHVYCLRVRVAPYPEAYSPNVFLVVHSGHAVMIDAGFPDDESVQKRDTSSRSANVEHIVATTTITTTPPVQAGCARPPAPEC